MRSNSDAARIAHHLLRARLSALCLLNIFLAAPKASSLISRATDSRHAPVLFSKLMGLVLRV